MARRGEGFLSVSPCRRVQRLLLDFFPLPHRVSRLVESRADLLKSGDRILETDGHRMGRDVGLDLRDPLHGFDGPTGPRGCAPSDHPGNGQSVGDAGRLGRHCNAQQHHCENECLSHGASFLEGVFQSSAFRVQGSGKAPVLACVKWEIGGTFLKSPLPPGRYAKFCTYCLQGPGRLPVFASRASQPHPATTPSWRMTGINSSSVTTLSPLTILR